MPSPMTLHCSFSRSVAAAIKRAYRPALSACLSPTPTQRGWTFSVRYTQTGTASHIRKMGAPVILCGKTESMGTNVIALLKPEFEVIHFIPTPEAGSVQIPAIFRGEQSPPSDSQLGSKNYSDKPVAVILGGGYNDADTEVMMKAATGIHPVPWLRPDLSKPAPPLGPEYGKALVARIKKLVPELEKEGKMLEEKVVWY